MDTEKLRAAGLHVPTNNHDVRLAPVANRNMPSIPNSSAGAVEEAREKQRKAREGALRSRLIVALGRGFGIKLTQEEAITLSGMLRED
jgi:hypothetical protein